MLGTHYWQAQTHLLCTFPALARIPPSSHLLSQKRPPFVILSSLSQPPCPASQMSSLIIVLLFPIPTAREAMDLAHGLTMQQLWHWLSPFSKEMIILSTK